MHFFGSVFTQPLSQLKLLIVADKTNPKTKAVSDKLSSFSHKQPNLIAVIGGDGFMLHAIRKYCHKKLPFFGINTGHRGFLLNELPVIEKNFPTELNIHHLPLLEVEMVSSNQKTKRLLAFNDVWVERAKSQTAWIEVKVNGITRLDNLISDAALLATPAGSTAYAMAMGASPLPLDAQAVILAGSNVSSPVGFKPCYLPFDSQVEFTAIDPIKRPLFGVIDGIRQGKVNKVRATVSETASVQIAFASNHSLAEKLVGIQFPNWASQAKSKN